MRAWREGTRAAGQVQVRAQALPASVCGQRPGEEDKVEVCFSKKRCF